MRGERRFHAHLVAARTNLLRRRLAAAEAHFTAALALRPGSVEAAHELGRMLVDEARQPVRAVRWLRHAVTTHPTDAHLWWHLGQALYHTGDMAAAAEAYRTSAELDPEEAKTYLDLASCLRYLDDMPGALEAIDRAMAIDDSVWPIAIDYNDDTAMLEAITTLLPVDRNASSSQS